MKDLSKLSDEELTKEIVDRGVELHIAQLQLENAKETLRLYLKAKDKRKKKD